MNATVIDTLRFANRLKQAGFEPDQAEAVSRAFNDELVEGLVTKTDLDAAVTTLRGEIGKLENTMLGKFAEIDAKFGQIDAKFEAIDHKFDAMDAKFDAKFEAIDHKFDAMDAKFDAKFDAMDAKFDAMDAKFGALENKFDALQSKVDNTARYVFLILAVVVALGLYNAVAPTLDTASQPAKPTSAATMSLTGGAPTLPP